MVVYVNQIYNNKEVIYLVTDEFYIYTLVRDTWESQTYFQISDCNDHVLVKVPVSRRYKTIMVDQEGAWVLKNSNRGSILFKYVDGNLYRYEED